MLCYLTMGSFPAIGQQLPPDQPEQDACNALLLCGNSFHTPYSYVGHGTKKDLSTTPCEVSFGSSTGEGNDMWLRLEVSTAGTIVFEITPSNYLDDYDWAVLNITNGNCNSLSPSQVVRCNFNQNAQVTNNGITGLNMTSTETGVAAGTIGHNYCKYISAQAGDVYLIMINNFGYNGNPSSGFTINFSGSTATFNNANPPTLNSIQNPCTNSNYAIITLNKPVTCASIASDGSDFSINGGNISSAQGINCTGSQGYTSQIKLLFNNTLMPGQYTIHAQSGTDGNTLLDLCANPLALPDSLNMTVYKLDSSITAHICENQLPYHWNGQIITQGGQGVAQATFPNTGGCDSVVTLNLVVTDTILANDNITICPDALPYTWDGVVVTTGGTHAANYFTQSVAGCDSLTYLNLTVQYPTTTSYHLEGCGEVVFNNRTYTQSQTASDTIISSYGCDSVYAQLHIIVHPIDTVSKTIDTAGCGSVWFNSKQYNSTQTLRDTLRNQYDCDSVYQITHIIVYPNHYNPHYYQVVNCDSVTYEGKTYYTNITLIDSFQNVLGCDSAIRYVNISPIHFQISLSADPDSPATNVFVRLKTHANDNNYRVLSWQPTSEFPIQNAYNQHFIPAYPGTYTFIVVGQDSNGCSGNDTLNLAVDSLYPNAFMPTAFSPNGDGLNDVFRPYFVNKSGFEVGTFKIFNRYGQLVYRTDRSLTDGWNGNYTNGQPAETGVYYYFIDIRFADGTKLHLKGDITLIR